MKKLFSFSLLLIIIQASFLPKIFYWQILAGQTAFYLALLFFLISRPRVVHTISIIVWLAVNFCPTADSIYEDTEGLHIFAENQSFILQNSNFQFSEFPDSYQPVEAALNNLQQKKGRVTVQRLMNSASEPLIIAAVETEGLYSFAGWEQNKILLRRLSAILRQEKGQVIVIIRGQGPVYASIAKAFAHQARLDKARTSSFISQAFGLGADIVLSRDLEKL